MVNDQRDLFDMLTPRPTGRGDGGMRLFSDHDLREHSTEFIKLDGGGMMGVLIDESRGLGCSFVVLDFTRGPSSPVREPSDAYVWGQTVFYGCGSIGQRALRHTYWGNGDGNGYIFYPHGALIADALVQLRRWFDCD